MANPQIQVVSDSLVGGVVGLIPLMILVAIIGFGINHMVNGICRGSKRRTAGFDSDAPACPDCGSSMVRRTRRRDGNRFWGCPNFPRCRGIRQMGDAAYQNFM